MRPSGDLPLPPMVGGYRLVRILARDRLATMALVHADGEARIARVFHLTVDDAAIAAEIAVHDALATGSLDAQHHIAMLDDVATLYDGRLAVMLTPVTGPSLADLLRTRHGDLDLGEAVTALAPIVAAVEAAHEVGVTGLRLDPHRIRFAASGAPVIVNVSGATAGPVLPLRFRRTEPAYADDDRRVAGLISAVSDAMPSAARMAMRALLPAARADRATVLALFDLAAPMPIRDGDPRDAAMRAADSVRVHSLHATDTAPIAPLSHAGDAAAPSSVEDSGSGTVRDSAPAAVGGGAIATVAMVLSALGLPERLRDGAVRSAAQARDALGLWGQHVRSLVGLAASHRIGARGARTPAAPAPGGVGTPDAGQRRRAAPVRRSVVIAGFSGGAALLVAVLVTVVDPPTSDGEPPPAAPASAMTLDRAYPAGAVPDSTDFDGVNPPTGSAPSSREAGLPEGVPRPEAEQWQAVVEELLTRWVSCRDQLDAHDGGAPSDCAATAAHPGSAADDLLRGGADDARHESLMTWLSVRGEVVVVERMGAAVIVDLVDAVAQTTTASLLLMRSEAGWRVRDVLD